MTNYRDDYFKANSSNHGWYTCVVCGKKLRAGNVDIDHILPQSLGGDDDLDNLQCMCKSCNRSKGNKTDDMIDDYLDNAARNYTKGESKSSKNLFGSLFKGLK